MKARANFKMKDILEETIANLRNKFAGEVNTNDIINRVKEILPINSSEYKILNVEGTNTKFPQSDLIWLQFTQSDYGSILHE